MERSKIDVSRASTRLKLLRLFEEVKEAAYLDENTFNGLLKRTRWSAPTLARYLRFCEENGLVFGYRFGKYVRYYVSVDGLRFLNDLFSETDLYCPDDVVLFCLKYPNAMFYGGPSSIDFSPAATLVVNGARFNLYGPEETEGVTGRVITLLTRLLRAVGLRLFTAEELASLNIKFDRGISEEDFERLQSLKPKRRPLGKTIKLLKLINWATLMNRNIYNNRELYRYISDKKMDFIII